MSQKPLCAEVEAKLAELVEGSLEEKLVLHIADCDQCRDLKHDSLLAAKLVKDAALDYDLPTISHRQRLEESLQPPPDAGTATSAGSAVNAPSGSTPSSTALAEPDDNASQHAASKAAIDANSPASLPKLVDVGAFLKSKKGAVAIALGVAAALWLVVSQLRKPESPLYVAGFGFGWNGKVSSILASSRRSAGLLVCPQGKGCEPARENDPLGPGDVIKTDAFTRVTLLFDDKSELTLDHSTELEVAKRGRGGRLALGALVAEIEPQRGESMTFELEAGRLEVLGTKFALKSYGSMATVDVSRGAVALIDEQDRKVTVFAGESGRLAEGEPPQVSGGASISQGFSWAEQVSQPEEGLTVKGLGELRAKKPGTGTELAGAVTLERHEVKVRVSGAFARTEVTEVFANHTDDVLEGIFRFPMPPGAQIERLALEVDGKMEEGAFVERDRASKIWTGAIVNANSSIKPPKEEIIWVPGPWKDPALLEWQRGGRFELRIYPLPKRATRKVVLTYTQVLAPIAGSRRYVYPLAHDASGSTTVRDFSLDFELRGHDSRRQVQPLGYSLNRAERDQALTFSFSEQNFEPRGDLSVEYHLPDSDREVSVFAYRAGSNGQPPSDPGVTLRGFDAQHTAVEDGYVAIALRPELPRKTSDRRLSLVFVVDASRSMFGEPFSRARALLKRAIAELDPRDKVKVLACHVECQPILPDFMEGGGKTASQVDDALRQITPEGASDMMGSIALALESTRRPTDREFKLVYLGDGTPTVGAILPGIIRGEASSLSQRHQVSFLAVGVGSDSDSVSLEALATAGRGAVVPYAPGRTTAEVAYDLLSAAYSTPLSDVRVDLPPGLYEMAPEVLPPLSAGGELLITARARRADIEGEVVLRGRHGNEAFEKRYPVRFAVDGKASSAFVPRLHAASRILDLERDGTSNSKAQAVLLSQHFNVASRFTSLLVLESPAMFRAFGLDNQRRAPEWTGEEEVDDALEPLSEGEGAPEDGYGALADSSSNLSAKDRSALSSGGIGGGRGGMPKGAPRSAAAPGARAEAQGEYSLAPPAVMGPAKAPPRDSKKAEIAMDGGFAEAPEREESRRREVLQPELNNPLPPGPQMVPMRRVWKRTGTFDATRTVPKHGTTDALAKAEREFERRGDARQNLIDLFRLYMAASEIGRASELASRWSEKEPLDPEALTALADVLARQGQRDLSIRTLGSVLDVRPGDHKAQSRLARLYRWSNQPRLACRFSLAIAQTRADDARSLAEVLRCSRGFGAFNYGEELAERASPSAKAAALKLAEQAVSDAINGDVRLEANWEGGDSDLDLALLHPDGHRISWLGAPSREIITARNVTSTQEEALGLNGAKAGQYLVEVVRASGPERPLRGKLRISIAGNVREVAFVLDGTRKTLGVARVTVHSELVPWSMGNQPNP